MKTASLNLVLALTWALATGAFSPANLVLGLGLGVLVTWLIERPEGSEGHKPYPLRLLGWIHLVLFFLWELLLANLRVAQDVLTAGARMRPGIVAVPLSARSEVEITVLALLVTLTPGTLALDVTSDRRVLYIHAMHIDEVEAFRRRIKGGIERRVLAALRGR